VVVSGFSICAKGYCWSCSLSTLHICNMRDSIHDLLSYPQNGDNRADIIQILLEYGTPQEAVGVGREAKFSAHGKNNIAISTL
jgi:hypothetical protein